MGRMDGDSRYRRDKLREKDRDSSRYMGGYRVHSRYSSRFSSRFSSRDRDNSRSKGRCSRDSFRDTALGRGKGGSRGAKVRVRSNCTVGTRKGALKGNRPVLISTSIRVFTRQPRAKTVSRRNNKT